jgi:hypothetical protein
VSLPISEMVWAQPATGGGLVGRSVLRSKTFKGTMCARWL